jgi:chromate transporter
VTADLWTIALVFGYLSLTSFGGGNVAIPEIHRQVVLVRGWVTEPQFAQAFALSRAAPGPSTLFVFLLGFKMAGWVGAIVASTCMYLPGAMLMQGACMALGRWERQPALRRIFVAMRPIAIGLVFASSYVVGKAAVTGPLTAGVFLAATALLAFTRVPVLVVLAGAAVLGGFVK